MSEIIPACGRVFDAKLETVPEDPGVYLMKDGSGSVIYVGKAKNLRKRLSSYFAGQLPPQQIKVRAMVSCVRNFDFVICNNELEAFVLESNLIKSYRPFYNILLRDDRDYPYLKITLNEEYPRILKAYRIGKDVREGAKYFGPFLQSDLYRAIKTVHEIFPLKTCRRVFPRDIGKERPCLNYYIKRCIGPCTGKIDAEKYRAVVLEVIELLEGRYSGLLKKMEEKMRAAAEKLDFEAAALWRDRAEKLKRLLEKQVAVTSYKGSMDAAAVAISGSQAVIERLAVREGKISAATTHFLSGSEDGKEACLAAFISQYYSEHDKPEELLLPFPLSPENTALIEKFIKIAVPKRGSKRDIVLMAEKTAEKTLRREIEIKSGGKRENSEAEDSLRELFGIKNEGDLRIEAFDIANFGTTDKAAGMAVFFKGKAERKSFRIFKIKSVEGQDDYASMREALARRFERFSDKNFGEVPDLILVDGGTGHVSAAVCEYEKWKSEHASENPFGEGKSGPKIGGLVKDERHRTRGLVLGNGELIDLRSEERKSLLHFATRIQNEAHRIAGRYTSKLSEKRQMRYKLEDIRGVGPSKRKALLEAFGGIKAISEADTEQFLKKVPTLGKKTAESVYRYFHQNKEGL